MSGMASQAELPTEDRAAAGTRGVLMEAAFALAGEIPLSDLTLRPLAERAGVSVATLTHHFGHKQAVLDALIATSISRETTFYHAWEQTLSGLPIVLHDARARMASVVFEDWLARNRAPLLVLLDLLRSPDLSENGPQSLRQWIAIAGPFWSQLLFGVAERREPALGYVIDEAAFALGSLQQPLYRALRRLCLETLIGRTAAGRPASDEEAELFTALVAALAPSATPPASDQLGKRARAIVEATADLLTSADHTSITHRSVAEATGVSAATVVYRFGSTEDLIVAGIYGVIDRFKRGAAGAGPASPSPLADLVRATGVVALAGARMPMLAPHALDMRRRRGENVKADTLIEAGVPPALAADPIFRQQFAIALFGSRRLAYALGGVSDAESGRAILEGLLLPVAVTSPA